MIIPLFTNPDEIELVPLNGIVLVVSVALYGGAVVGRDVPQLMGLVPQNKKRTGNFLFSFCLLLWEEILTQILPLCRLLLFLLETIVQTLCTVEDRVRFKKS